MCKVRQETRPGEWFSDTFSRYQVSLTGLGINKFIVINIEYCHSDWPVTSYKLEVEPKPSGGEGEVSGNNGRVLLNII